MKKIVGIGNAILDRSIQVTEEELQALNLIKGSMQLIDEETLVRLSQMLSEKPSVMVAGGSCANTIAGLGFLGVPSSFFGKVHADASGEAFVKSMADVQAQCVVAPMHQGPQTAQCLVLITPDAERTMLTYLGACLELDANDLSHQAIQEAELIYVEGYLWDSPKAREALLGLRERNPKADIAFTTSDPFCVQRHRDAFLSFIQTSVRILFCNEAEGMALFGTENLSDTYEAARALKKNIVITRSEKGSVIVSEKGEQVFVEAVAPSPRLVDMTGAGDLYAAGFLYGFLNAMSLPACGKLGSLAAAEVIGHYGARPKVCVIKQAKDLALL